jgi:peptidoglycan/LPS O-acetylase OafA/YrhL
MVATALLVLAIAVPMRHWVEIPFARIRKRLHQRRQAKGPKIVAMAQAKADR